MNMKKKQIQAKAKNSVEKCKKKVLKPFKLSDLFDAIFISDPMNVFATTMGAINMRITW